MCCTYWGALRSAGEDKPAPTSPNLQRPSQPYEWKNPSCRTNAGDPPQDDQQVPYTFRRNSQPYGGTQTPDAATGRAARNTDKSEAAGSTASGTSRPEGTGSTASANATHSGHEPGAWGFGQEPAPEGDAAANADARGKSRSEGKGSAASANATQSGYDPGAWGWDKEPAPEHDAATGSTAQGNRGSTRSTASASATHSGYAPGPWEQEEGPAPPDPEPAELSPEQRDFLTNEVLNGLQDLKLPFNIVEYLTTTHLQSYAIPARLDTDMNRQAWRAVHNFVLGIETDAVSRWVCQCGSAKSNFNDRTSWWNHFVWNQTGWWHSHVDQDVRRAWTRWYNYMSAGDLHPYILAAENVSALACHSVSEPLHLS